LLGSGPVIAKTVSLDDKAQLGPEEVHSKSIDVLLSQRSGQPGAKNQAKKARLELGVGEPEVLSIEERAEGCNTSLTGAITECTTQLLRVDQSNLVRLIDKPFELPRIEGACKVDDRPDGSG
jgi:hypothetical protein